MRYCLAWLVVVGLYVSPASAQNFGRPPGPGSPGYRPPVSPFLNLNRGGSAAINYFGIVRPQVEGAQALQQLEQQVNPSPIGAQSPLVVDQLTGAVSGGAVGSNTAVGATQTTGVLPTAAGYFTHNRFYMTVRPGASPGGGGGGGVVGGGNQNFGLAPRIR